jgi:hypothetical protein
MHFDNRDPVEAPPVSRRFYAGKIRQLDKPIGRNFCAEAPSLGVAGFEISKGSSADRVDKDIARVAVERFIGAGKPATECLELSDIHLRSSARGATS